MYTMSDSSGVWGVSVTVSGRIAVPVVISWTKCLDAIFQRGENVTTILTAVIL